LRRLFDELSAIPVETAARSAPPSPSNHWDRLRRQHANQISGSGRHFRRAGERGHC